MVLLYDPLAPFSATALRFAHTVLPHILCRKDIWVFMLLHCTITTLYRFGHLPGADVPKSFLFIDWNYISIITGLTTFFEVFYTMSSFSRYMHMYDVTGKMLDDVCGFSFLASVYLKETHPQHMRLATRYLMTSVILFFWGLRGADTTEIWQDLIQRGLVKPQERDFLMKFPTMQRSTVMLHLCAKVIGSAPQIFQDKEQKMIFKHVISKLTKVRMDKQEIVDTLFLQLPFQYFHILNIMVQMNLIIWAYGMAITDSMFGPVAYFFATLIFMGLMELANQLADPYGEDETDFPMDSWMTQMLVRNILVVERDNPHETVLASSLSTTVLPEGKLDGGSQTQALMGCGRARAPSSSRELWMTWGDMESLSLRDEGPLPAKEAEYVVYVHNEGYTPLRQNSDGSRQAGVPAK